MSEGFWEGGDRAILWSGLELSVPISETFAGVQRPGSGHSVKYMNRHGTAANI